MTYASIFQVKSEAAAGNKPEKKEKPKKEKKSGGVFLILTFNFENCYFLCVETNVLFFYIYIT